MDGHTYDVFRLRLGLGLGRFGHPFILKLVHHGGLCHESDDLCAVLHGVFGHFKKWVG